MLITNKEGLAQRAKHLTTTAKLPHPWEFDHDSVGFNYRMPNINAAVGCAQIENLTKVLDNKRDTSNRYSDFFADIGIPFFLEPKNSRSNYWLNSIIFKNKSERDKFLGYANSMGVQVRPVWKLMNHLPMFSQCQHASLDQSQWFEERIVNIPSSVKS